MVAAWGVDVSHYQGHVPWPTVAAAGVRFAIAKATEPGYGTDPTLPYNLLAGQDAGLLMGAYHFMRPTPGGATQADQFLAAVGDPAGLLLALDLEVAGLTIGLVTDWADRVKSRTGKRPLIYTNILTWRDRLGDPPGRALGPLWLAYPVGGGYPGDSSPWWNYGFRDWPGPLVWQYGPRTIAGTTYDGDRTLDWGALQALAGGLSGGTSQPGGNDSMINAGGLAISSDYVVEVPGGTDYYASPGADHIGTIGPAVLDYYGLTDNPRTLAVEVHSPTRIVYIPVVGNRRRKTPDELAATAAQYAPPPPPGPTQTDVAAAYSNGFADARSAGVQAVGSITPPPTAPQP